MKSVVVQPIEAANKMVVTKGWAEGVYVKSLTNQSINQSIKGWDKTFGGRTYGYDFVMLVVSMGIHLSPTSSNSIP